MNIEEMKDELQQPSTLSSFIVNPRDTLIKYGLDPDNEEVVKTFEPFLIEVQDGLARATSRMGRRINPEVAITGIGFGCCNTLER